MHDILHFQDTLHGVQVIWSLEAPVQGCTPKDAKQKISLKNGRVDIEPKPSETTLMVFLPRTISKHIISTHQGWSSHWAVETTVETIH
jgi:hypothetical protein